MRARQRRDDDDLDSLFPATARAGEVWWCEGKSLAFSDGGKTRPVLVVSLSGDEVRVVPLTTQKPDGRPVAVAHRAGLSWMAFTESRFVPRSALVSSLGPWAGFAAWRQRSG